MPTDAIECRCDICHQVYMGDRSYSIELISKWPDEYDIYNYVCTDCFVKVRNLIRMIKNRLV